MFANNNAISVFSPYVNCERNLILHLTGSAKQPNNFSILINQII
jgi:hypothetical protein